MSKQFPKLTPELIDSLNTPDATWPDDPAVPKLPPLPTTDDLPPPKDNWLATHMWDGLHPQKASALRSRPVTSADPLKVDVIFSLRSPYSYLSLQRLVWLNSNYNVDVTIRLVLPEAVRSTGGGSGSAAGNPNSAFARWYMLTWTLWDTVQMGTYQGIPFKWPTPDPIWQTIYPGMGKGWEYVHPPEKQPYISWIVRLGCYAQLKGKSLDYNNEVSSLIWGAEAEHWPAHVKERFNRIEGLDYDEAISYIRENPEKVDREWQENAAMQVKAGHGGVPLMIYDGEPFFGEDRFDAFYWRLRQNGLTQRQEPARAPFTGKPLRWPVDQ